jgi:hypothetical protein
MRYYLDTEFHETGTTIELISIGIVAEDGRQLYCESSEYDWSQASDWLKENVKPHLWSQAKDKREFNAWIRDGNIGGLMPRNHIAIDVKRFCDPDIYGKPEFWGYYADYDWVVFCWLFGSMIALPKGFPMFCNDLKQDADRLGIRFPKMDAGEHHALSDAIWNKEMHEGYILPNAQLKGADRG